MKWCTRWTVIISSTVKNSGNGSRILRSRLMRKEFGKQCGRVDDPSSYVLPFHVMFLLFGKSFSTFLPWDGFSTFCLEAKGGAKNSRRAWSLRASRRAAAQQSLIPIVCNVILLIIREHLILTTGRISKQLFISLWCKTLQALYSACVLLGQAFMRLSAE